MSILFFFWESFGYAAITPSTPRAHGTASWRRDAKSLPPQRPPPGPRVRLKQWGLVEWVNPKEISGMEKQKKAGAHSHFWCLWPLFLMRQVGWIPKVSARVQRLGLPSETRQGLLKVVVTACWRETSDLFFRSTLSFTKEISKKTQHH